jgi:hypothetical protein
MKRVLPPELSPRIRIVPEPALVHDPALSLGVDFGRVRVNA